MKKQFLFISVLLFILFQQSLTAQWTSIGPVDSIGLTNLYLDTESNILFVGDFEGFWFYDIDGDQWTNVTQPGYIGREVRSITAHPDLSGRIITGRVNAFFKGYMELTNDWGFTDEFVYESTGGVITDVKYCPSQPDQMFACGWSDIAPGELLKSVDGGQSWTSTTNYLHSAMTEISIHPTDENIVYVSGDAKITKTVDGGVTWLETYDGMPAGLGVYCVSIDPFNTDLLLCSNDNGMYKSEDAGANWIQINNIVVKRFAFNSIYENYVAAITFSPYTVLISNDKGENWTDITNSFPGDVMKDLTFSKEANELYVVSNNEIFSVAVDVSASTNESQIENNSLSNYPNPFSIKTTIRFNNPYENAKICLKLYNVMGQEMKSISNYTSNVEINEVEIDRTDTKGNILKSGIYFCDLIINDVKNSTIKIILD